MRIARSAGVLVLLALASGAGAARAQEITGNHRLQGNFIQDGAILRQGWLEARALHNNWGGGHDFAAGALVAFSVAERFELGGRFGYLDRKRSRDDVLFGEKLSSSTSENGPGDLDLYGKFRFGSGSRDYGAGLLVKLPTADEGERLGSGSTDYEGFFALRRTYQKFAWIGNASIRANGDARTPGGGAGKISGALGGGAILKLSYSWVFMAETRYETRRYDGGDVAFSITPSFDFRPTENLAFRLGMAFGLADGSPDQEVVFGAVFHF